MERHIDMKDISDGRLYSSNDMVKADCGGCHECFSCCCGMGTSIVLDPFDIFNLTSGLNKSFEELLKDKIELNVFDGIILPDLKMTDKNNSCTFLDADGRCSIHDIRPGICRLFPLGRFYEDNSFKYFLQIHECKNKNRSKVKVHKWIGIPDIEQYEKFIGTWHYLLKDMQETIKSSSDISKAKEISMYLLNTFYITPYNKSESFYEQFYKRMP